MKMHAPFQLTDSTSVTEGQCRTKCRDLYEKRCKGVPPSKHRCYPLFSSEDADLAAFNWRLNRGGYARRKPTVFAHRIVASRVAGRTLEKTEIVDHINGNKIDNRRENLRITNAAGNAQNRHSDGPFRGTTFNKKVGKWQATACFEGRRIYIGVFLSREEAAKAAANKRQELGFLTDQKEAA